MVKTSVVGFPRIGPNRELKKVVEGYFSGNISKQELFEQAANLRRINWQLQQNSNIDFIPSNDFSFYDNFLDTAMLIGVIPKRYKELGLDELKTYFAMAKGYQDGKNDVKALPMKKWFNTNYHYIVAEIDENTEFKICSNKPFDEFLEAKQLGINTKPVLVGPLTFLKLSNINIKNKNWIDFIYDITDTYIQIINKFSSIGAGYIQIDEPILVTDLNKEDIEAFEIIYKKILEAKENLKIILQTYFGNIKDIYNNIVKLNFDGIGLDFFEGKENIELIKTYGFPKDKLLFAGVINGKNIWKNDYKNTLDILSKICEHVNIENIIISTSCSLLFVPYSTEYETKLPDEIKKQFSFAYEKLKELNEVAEILNSEKPLLNNLYIKNQDIINERKIRNKNKLCSFNDDEFIRKPDFKERIALQKESLNLPLLPTTTIGSFPQTKELRKVRKDYKDGKIDFNTYDSFIKQKIKEVISLQEEIGLDVLVHGEFERNDMVEYFGENLEGFVITQNGWVQSYGTRCVKPPIIFGDIKRTKPITIEYIKYAQSLTPKPVKGMLTGPVTIVNWSFPREDITFKDMVYQIAEAIKEEVLDLENNGCKIIQVDEAALREKLPLRKTEWEEYLKTSINAFNIVISKVNPQTQIHTHMCYSEFNDIINYIDNMNADCITFEAARSNLEILDALNNSNFKMEVGPGVYDIHSPRIPSVEEIKDIIQKIINKIDKNKVWVNPDCGLKTRNYNEVIPSLTNMINATKEIRENI